MNRKTLPEKVEQMSRRDKSKEDSRYVKALLTATALGVIGLVTALPPLLADSKWRAAQVSRDLTSLEKTMKQSSFNPANTSKYLVNIQTLEQSNYQSLARKYALEAVAWNPEAYDLWRILFLISQSTPEEKNLAIQNMKRLDPLNPDVTSTK